MPTSCFPRIKGPWLYALGSVERRFINDSNKVKQRLFLAKNMSTRVNRRK
jgi:hypothetical protein